MIQNDSIRLVDFQGGRWGPYTYDLASLLLDPYVTLPDEIHDAAAQRYREGAIQSGIITADSPFVDHYRTAALQRIMQALGAYGFLSHVKGKTTYLRYIPSALKRLRLQLSTTERYPSLKGIVDKIPD